MKSSLFKSVAYTLFLSNFLAQQSFSAPSGIPFANRDIPRGPIGTMGIWSGSSLPSYRYDDYDFEKYQRIEQDASWERDRSSERMDRASRDYDQAGRNLSALQSSMDMTARNLESLKRRQFEISSAIQTAQNKIAEKQAEIPTIQAQLNDANANVANGNSQLAELQAQLAQATTDEEKSALNAKIEAKKADIAGAQNVANSIQNQLNQANAELGQANNELQTLPRELERVTRDSNSAESNLASLASQLEQAKRDLEVKSRDRDLAARDLERTSRNLDEVRRALENIRRNIELAAQVLRSQGQDQGTNDGYREGNELGNSRGQADGNRVGQNEGTSAGISAGQKRDYDKGYADGIVRATKDADDKATADGRVNGSADGVRVGTQDGLNSAYQLGRQEGLKNGKETGSDKAAYQAGVAEGKVAGLASAVADAKPQEGLGFKNKENEYLNAKLNPVTVGDQNLARKLQGLQGVHSPEGDDRYYRPNPGMLPHPRLEKYYLEAYDESFRANVSSAYSQSYRSAYDSNYNTSYRSSYDREVAKAYPDSERAGYKQGYDDTYKVVYNRTYNVVYKAAYQENYDQAFNQNKLDAGRRAAGFADGNREASKQKGYDDAFRDTYAANIEIEKKKAYQAGVDRATNLYTNNPILKLESIELKETDNDGIYRPGETLQVVVKLKNFGLKPKVDLSSDLDSASGAILVQNSKLVAASIPPQSDVTLVMPAQATVSNKANDGESFSVTLKATSDGKTLIESRKDLVAQYPTAVAIQGFDGILVPGVETAVKIKVQNRSKSTQNLNVAVQVQADKVVASSTNLVVDSLAAGASKDLEVKLTGKPEAKFEETSLKLVTTQLNSQWAMDQALGMTIIRKHVTTADSKGLILSSNLAKGAGKKLFATDKFDTWDLRVDGPISNLASLEDYKNKVIHVMADANAVADKNTLDNLQKYFANNRSIVVWGSRLDLSSLAATLLPNLGVKLGVASSTNSTVTGSDRLSGLKLPVNAGVNLVESNSSKASTVLVADKHSVGTVTFSQGTQDQVGLAFVLGLDLNSLADADAKALLAQIELARSSFTNKLNLANNNPATYMYQIALELSAEMVSAELLGTGKFYSDNDKSNKIYRAAAKFIGEDGRNSSQAAELAKNYPYLVQVLKTKLSKEQWRCELVMEKRHGGFFTSRNIKDIYCNSNGNSELCRADDSNR